MKNFAAFLLSIVLICVVDQVLLYQLGARETHFLFCSLRNCDESPFVRNSEVYFLVNPQKSKFLKEISNSKQIPLDTKYNLDSNGFRLSTIKPSKGKKIVNVYGDSFTFGLFLNDSETIIENLNRISQSCYFKNYGVPAFDLWQMMNLKKSKGLTPPAEHHLYLFISDDLRRITRPTEVNPIGRPTRTHDLAVITKIKNHQVPWNIPLALIRNSFFFQKLYQKFDHDWWSKIPHTNLLKLLIKDKNESDSLFIHLPSIEDYYQEDDGKFVFGPPIKDPVFLLEGMNEIMPHTKLFYPNDSHLTPYGAKVLSQKITKKIKALCP